MKEALLYKKIDGRKINCRACYQYCVVDNGQRGICGIRENDDGKLYSLVYGKVIALNIDPIEKKPLFHFLPGSETLSLATAGCNFKCLNCQNADISQLTKNDRKTLRENLGKKISPEKIIEMALTNKTPSISYTYTEPTIFVEYALDIMKLAHQKNIKNIWVTNGYFSPETFEIIRPYLDAANVDLKFFSDKFYQQVCGAKLQPILDNLRLLKKNKIWFEITTLLIPNYIDQEKQLENITKFIKTKLDAETPWHISAFSPTYKMNDLSPTSFRLVEQAYQIGQNEGLKYVYTGNLSNIKSHEDTTCPNCGQVNIKRSNYQIQRLDKNGFCHNCERSLDLILK